MSRGTWTIARKVADVWGDIGTIYRPNSNLPLQKISTQAASRLADGSIGYIAPETKYNDSPLKFVWGYLPKTYVDQIDAYVEGLWDLRITDHNATIYYGRFVNITSTWIVGEEDKYDVAAEFQIIPSIAW